MQEARHGPASRLARMGQPCHDPTPLGGPAATEGIYGGSLPGYSSALLQGDPGAGPVPCCPCSCRLWGALLLFSHTLLLKRICLQIFCRNKKQHREWQWRPHTNPFFETPPFPASLERCGPASAVAQGCAFLLTCPGTAALAAHSLSHRTG